MADPNNRRRPWVYIVIALLVLFAAWWLYSMSGGPDSDNLGPGAGASLSGDGPAR